MSTNTIEIFSGSGLQVVYVGDEAKYSLDGVEITQEEYEAAKKSMEEVTASQFDENATMQNVATITNTKDQPQSDGSHYFDGGSAKMSVRVDPGNPTVSVTHYSCGYGAQNPDYIEEGAVGDNNYVVVCHTGAHTPIDPKRNEIVDAVVGQDNISLQMTSGFSAGHIAAAHDVANGIVVDATTGKSYNKVPTIYINFDGSMEGDACDSSYKTMGAAGTPVVFVTTDGNRAQYAASTATYDVHHHCTSVPMNAGSPVYTIWCPGEHSENWANKVYKSGILNFTDDAVGDTSIVRDISYKGEGEPTQVLRYYREPGSDEIIVDGLSIAEFQFLAQYEAEKASDVNYNRHTDPLFMGSDGKYSGHVNKSVLAETMQHYTDFQVLEGAISSLTGANASAQSGFSQSISFSFAGDSNVPQCESTYFGTLQNAISALSSKMNTEIASIRNVGVAVHRLDELLESKAQSLGIAVSELLPSSVKTEYSKTTVVAEELKDFGELEDANDAINAYKDAITTTAVEDKKVKDAGGKQVIETTGTRKEAVELKKEKNYSIFDELRYRREERKEERQETREINKAKREGTYVEPEKDKVLTVSEYESAVKQRAQEIFDENAGYATDPFATEAIKSSAEAQAIRELEELKPIDVTDENYVENLYSEENAKLAMEAGLDETQKTALEESAIMDTELKDKVGTLDDTIYSSDRVMGSPDGTVPKLDTIPEAEPDPTPVPKGGGGGGAPAPNFIPPVETVPEIDPTDIPSIPVEKPTESVIDVIPDVIEEPIKEDVVLDGIEEYRPVIPKKLTPAVPERDNGIPYQPIEMSSANLSGNSFTGRATMDNANVNPELVNDIGVNDIVINPAVDEISPIENININENVTKPVSANGIIETQTPTVKASDGSAMIAAGLSTAAGLVAGAAGLAVHEIKKKREEDDDYSEEEF